MVHTVSVRARGTRVCEAKHVRIELQANDWVRVVAQDDDEGTLEEEERIAEGEGDGGTDEVSDVLRDDCDYR